MNSPARSPLLSRLTGGRRRTFSFGIALALLAATSIGLAAPTAFGQSALTLPGQTAAFNPFEHEDRMLCPGRAEPGGTSAFLRTELYFGSNTPNGTVVTPEQFQKFLNEEITPRFPDGLTLLTGLGQFRGSSGTIQRERSMVLILLYPVDTARTSGENIEQIRSAYKKAFNQESVLRADDPLPQCVSF